MSQVVKIVTVDKEGQINIEQFADMIDVSRIEYYELTPTSKDNSFLLQFFDKNKKLIKPKPIKPKKPKSKKAA